MQNHESDEGPDGAFLIKTEKKVCVRNGHKPIFIKTKKGLYVRVQTNLEIRSFPCKLRETQGDSG